MHISTQSEEIWPPEMEIEILREEYKGKEMEWQTTIDTAHWKLMKLRDEYYETMLQLQEMTNTLQEMEEKVVFLEEKGKLDEKEIDELRDSIDKNELLLLEYQTEKENKEEEEKEKSLSSSNKSDGGFGGAVGGWLPSFNDKNDELLKQQQEQITEMNAKVDELERYIQELETQNTDAKEYIQDIVEKTKQKREEIQNIVLKEKEKNKEIVVQLEASKSANSELTTELDRVNNELLVSQQEIRQKNEEALHQRQEQERAAILAQESLDSTAATLKQTESRELKLKDKLKKITRKLGKTKKENAKSNKQIEELKTSLIEKEMEQYDKSMELMVLEKDWKVQVDNLTDKIQGTQDSRDYLSRQILRLRQALNEKDERHKVQLKVQEGKWEEKFQTQKMECSSLAHELKTEIMRLNNNIINQEKVIKEMEIEIENGRNSLEANAVVPTNEAEEQVGSDGDNTPKRFSRIRKKVNKLKKWLRD